jgi:hypothetical protein
MTGGFRLSYGEIRELVEMKERAEEAHRLIRESGLTGWEYEVLLNLMNCRALDDVWETIRSGRIYTEMARMNRAPTRWRLRNTDIDDLTQEMVIRGTATFEKREREGKGWDPGAKKGLGDYFRDLCVGHFNNVLRDWWIANEREGIPTGYIGDLPAWDTNDENPAQAVEEAIDKVCPGETGIRREVIRGMIDEEKTKDAAERLNRTIKAIEGLKARIRRRHGRRGGTT